MDSMWGYKTQEYREFGWAAARADDVLAYIPARLTALLLLLAGMLMKLDWRGAVANFRADAAKMESPNAGWPMAVCAWLFGATMGGPAEYFGEYKLKPILGPEGQDWALESLKKLSRLVLLSGLAGVVLFQAARVLLLAVTGVGGN
jgi:adenosylcobinamide-phosphate synthase